MANVATLYASIGMPTPRGAIEPGDLLTVVGDDPANPGAIIIEHMRTRWRYSQLEATLAHTAYASPAVRHRRQ